MPSLYLKKGDGWNRVDSVVDVRVMPGKIVLETGQEVNGDVVTIIMDYQRDDDGQKVLRRLVGMDPRILDMRVVGERTLDMSVIVCGEEVDEHNPKRYAVTGRVMGVRRAGALPTRHGSGGSVV